MCRGGGGHVYGDTEFVIIAIRKAVPQKSGARTIDCALMRLLDH